MKKGISPLIAAVLLIAFTVSIGTIVLGWLGSFAQSTTDTIENRTNQAVDCSNAAITIETVYVTAGSGGQATAIVKNSAFVDGLVISAAQLFTTNGTNVSATEVPVSGFDRGEVVSLTFNNTNIPTCPNNFSQVIVSTSCGGVSDTFDGSPKCT